MQLHRILSSSLIAAALVGAPIAASADPAREASVTDAQRYAELEKESPAAATFQGGGQGVYIGGGALTIVLIILLVLVIL